MPTDVVLDVILVSGILPRREGEVELEESESAGRGSGGKNVIFLNGPRVDSEY